MLHITDIIVVEEEEIERNVGSGVQRERAANSAGKTTRPKNVLRKERISLKLAKFGRTTEKGI